MCEVKCHAVDRSLSRTFDGLFPGRALNGTHVIVTLALQTVHRQTAMSTEMLEERERMHAALVERMKAFGAAVKAEGYWFDFIEPGTGTPSETDSPDALLECDERYRKLGFTILELGCCRALCNETFGQCLVMTSAFIESTEADISKLLDILEQAPVGSFIAPSPANADDDKQEDREQNGEHEGKDKDAPSATPAIAASAVSAASPAATIAGASSAYPSATGACCDVPSIGAAAVAAAAPGGSSSSSMAHDSHAAASAGSADAATTTATAAGAVVPTNSNNSNAGSDFLGSSFPGTLELERSGPAMPVPFAEEMGQEQQL